MPIAISRCVCEFFDILVVWYSSSKYRQVILGVCVIPACRNRSIYPVKNPRLIATRKADIEAATKIHAGSDVAMSKACC